MVTVTGQKKELYPWLEHFSLEGKVALLIGAGSGLCRETAKGVAMCGAQCIFMDIKPDGIESLTKELTDVGLKAEPYVADVTDSKQCQEVVKYIADKYGHLDIMINAAGTADRMPTEEFDEAKFDRIININLKGTFLMLKYAGAQMLKQENGGSIINFGSIASVVGNPGSIAYSASKGAVALMTKSAAVEWATKKVRVNAILPGTYTTPLLQKCIDEDPAYEDYFLKRYPIGRWGDPEELVGAIIYLASDASTYTTGILLAADGACTAY